jgi:predicted RND superfamily exporter protein
MRRNNGRRRLPERLVCASLRHPRRVFAVWIAIAALATPGVLCLEVDTSTDSVLERSDQSWHFYQQSQDTFGGDEIIVVALEADVPLAPSALREIAAITDALEDIDGVRRVDSLASVPLIRADPDGSLDLGAALAGGVPETAPEVRALARRLRADRIAPRAFVSEDGRVLSANVVLERADRVAFEAVVAAVRERTEGHRVWISGVPVFRTETNVWTRREVGFFVPLTVLVVGLILYFTFGSLRAVWIPLGTSAFGSWLVLSALGATGAPLNILTMILPSVMLALGCAYVMHLLTAAVGAEDEAALRGALTPRALPIALSGLTTAIGFVAISLVRIDAVRFVGGFGALGVLAVLAATLTLAPAALGRWPLPARSSLLTRWTEERLRPLLMAWVSGAPRRIIGAWCITLALFAVGAARLDVVTDVTVWFPRGTPVRDAYEEIRARLSGISPMNVVVQAEDGASVATPEAFAAIDGLTAHLEALPEVGKALSYADPLRQLHEGFAGDPAVGLPDSEAMIEQYLLLLESVEQLGDLVSDDRRSANILLRVDDNGSASLLDVARAAAAWWEEHGPPGFSARTTGIMFEFARAEHEIAMGQLRGLGFALVAIGAVLLAFFRRPSLALKVLFPNAIPVVVVFGVMGFAGIPLDAGTVLVGSLAIGIAVDDAVHIVSEFHEGDRAGEPPEAALDETFRRVLPAVVFTSITVAGGFSALVFSQFTFIRHLGALTAGVMLLCLLANATLLPTLLLRRR